jgi:hypothetical protein
LGFGHDLVMGAWSLVIVLFAFTPVESPAIYGGDVETKYSFIIEGGVKAPSR